MKELNAEICSEKCIIEKNDKHESVGFQNVRKCAYTFPGAFIFIFYAYVLRAVVN